MNCFVIAIAIYAYTDNTSKTCATITTDTIIPNCGPCVNTWKPVKSECAENKDSEKSVLSVEEGHATAETGMALR